MSKKRVWFGIVTLVLTISIGLYAAGDTKADRNCEKAGRDRQKAEIDHTTGRNSAKDLNDAKVKEQKECRKAEAQKAAQPK